MTANSTQADKTQNRAPGPRGDCLLGSLPQFQRDPIGLLLRSAREYGDVVRFRLGPLVAHLVNHPQYVEQLLSSGSSRYDKRTRSVSRIRATCGDSLLSSDGESWLRHRRLIQPVFRFRELEPSAPLIVAATTRMLDNWRDLARSEHEIDLVSEMMHLTFNIAAQVLFGADIENEAAIVERSLAVILRDTWRRIESLFDPSQISSRLHRPDFQQAVRDIDKIVYRMIENRRRRKSPANDLLSRLLEAHDAESESRMSDRELRDAAVTLLLAGHETTANALAWTFYLLSQSPEIDQRLFEATDAFDSTEISARKPCYAEMIFSEAIRLYPSVWIIERRAVVDDEIGGYAIPAGSTVMLSPYVLHRHPEFWHNPEHFTPDRFTAAACSERPRHAYIPFGAGPHQCVGQNMALLVARVIITLVNRQFRLQLVPGQTITPLPGITLRHTNGLRMTLQLRP